VGGMGTSQQGDNLFADGEEKKYVGEARILRSTLHLHPHQYKSSRDGKPSPRVSHDQTDLYKNTMFDLSPKMLPAPLHQSLQFPLVPCPDLAMYEEMMANIDASFASPQNTNFSDLRAGLASVGSSDASESYGFMYPKMENNSPNLPATGTDAFTLMSTAPAPMVWEDWDPYIQDLIKETGMRGGVYAGQL